MRDYVSERYHFCFLSSFIILALQGVLRSLLYSNLRSFAYLTLFSAAHTAHQALASNNGWWLQERFVLAGACWGFWWLPSSPAFIANFVLKMVLSCLKLYYRLFPPPMPPPPIFSCSPSFFLPWIERHTTYTDPPPRSPCSLTMFSTEPPYSPHTFSAPWRLSSLSRQQETTSFSPSSAWSPTSSPWPSRSRSIFGRRQTFIMPTPLLSILPTFKRRKATSPPLYVSWCRPTRLRTTLRPEKCLPEPRNQSHVSPRLAFLMSSSVLASSMPRPGSASPVVLKCAGRLSLVFRSALSNFSVAFAWMLVSLQHRRCV